MKKDVLFIYFIPLHRITQPQRNSQPASNTTPHTTYTWSDNYNSTNNNKKKRKISIKRIKNITRNTALAQRFSIILCMFVVYYGRYCERIDLKSNN